jgi:hypothetical protein
MTFLRTYLRVLGLLAPEARLAVALALANIALALAQFIEPILLGHIVDALSGTLPAAIPAAAATLAPLLGAWVGFGLLSSPPRRSWRGFPTGSRTAAATWCWRISSSTSCNCR